MYIYTHIYILRIVVYKVTHAITSFVDLNHISLLTEPWNSYQFRKALLYTEAHLEETKETCSHSVPQVNFFFYASLSGSTWQRTIRFAILIGVPMFSKNLNSGLKLLLYLNPRLVFFLQFCINFTLLLFLLCILN